VKKRRRRRVKQPIMSPEAERFMAFEGLVQWTQAVMMQARRISVAVNQIRSREVMINPLTRRQAIHASHCEYHFFAIAAYKLIEHRDWALGLGLCQNVDFGEIINFSAADIRDLRNMREHVVDYFAGHGRDKDRWMVDTPEFRADASSVVGTMIGGRLDWLKFSSAAERLLPTLLAEPIPYPARA
jgi:hypothetical protein